MKKNQHSLKVTILFVSLFCKLFASAQGYPWYTGHYEFNSVAPLRPYLDANVTLLEGQTYYTDNDRAEIIDFTISATFNVTVKVTGNLAHRHGIFKSATAFVNANSNPIKRYRYFIVQAKTWAPDANGNWTNGDCVEVVINNTIDTSSGMIKFDVSNGYPVPYFDAGFGAVLQIVRVPAVNTFDLQGGVVTCHEYGGHTGGFLALRAFHLKLKSGYFDAAKKGYFPEDITWAGATPGQAGNNSLNNTSLTTLYRDNPNPCPDTIGLTLLRGGFGKKGDPAVANTFTPNSTIGTPTYYGRQHTLPHVRPKMGSAGYFKMGQKSGAGAEGGGHGGDGGSSQNGNFGASGGNGLNGTIGGSVGHGARGGGIIMLKIHDITWSSGNIYSNPGVKLFFINGENGAYGANGGDGGNGGPGGIGALGSVVGNTIYYQGGSGVNGRGGKGGSGGDGSNGGGVGSLAFHISQIGTGSISLYDLIRLTNSKAGLAGHGGQGGFDGLTGEPSKQSYPSPLPIGKYWCGGGGSPQMINICNCDSVFWALSSNKAVNVTTISQPYHYDFNLGQDKFDVYVKKDSAEVHLWSIRKGQFITSHCYLHKSRDCDPMMDQMANLQSLVNNGGNIDLMSLQASRVSISPLIVNFNKFATPYTTALQWNGAEGTLTDILQPGNPICYQGTCDRSNAVNRVRASSNGDLNEDGDSAIVKDTNPGPFAPPVDEANIDLYENWGVPPPQNNDPKSELEYIKISDRDNAFALAMNDIDIYEELIESLDYVIINSLGQVVNSGTVSEANQWQISKVNLASGFYSLILTSNNRRIIHKFVITR